MKGQNGFGKEDLYVINKNSNQWSLPVNLGSRVNSAGFEMSPYLSKDKRHLYFASDGHEGYGSSDVFVVSRLDDTWLNWSRPIKFRSGN